MIFSNFQMAYCPSIKNWPSIKKNSALKLIPKTLISMQYLLKNCGNCGAYTMEAKCPKCAGETKIAHPTKYSKEDKYAIYRRKELYPELFKD